MISAVKEKKIDSTLLEQVLWVEWIAPHSVKVLTEVDKLPRLVVGETISIHELIREGDVDKVLSFFNGLSIGCAAIQFTLKIGNRKTTSINCITYTDAVQTRCLWKIGDIERNDSLQLLATIAHDLRSPINSIIGLSNVLQLMLKESNIDTKEFGRMINMIKSSCNNALDFSGDLLELTEIESSNYQLKTEHVKVNDFLKGFVDTHRLVTLKKGIEVKIDSALDDSVTFQLNGTKMTRVLGNLLSNATKFSQPNDTICFRLENTATHLTIKVIDEGVGMSPEIVKNLFIKFGKSKRIGLDGEKSHGLGMSIVQQIVKLHNGKIKVDSKEGKGTTIILTFKNN